MKLYDLIQESKEENFKDFSSKRLKGATKIVNNTKEKGGPSMLTYHHFVVKLPYYKNASEGNFDVEKSKKEYKELLDKLCKTDDPSLGQVEFQKLVGKIEVIGELLIKHR